MYITLKVDGENPDNSTDEFEDSDELEWNFKQRKFDRDNHRSGPSLPNREEKAYGI